MSEDTTEIPRNEEEDSLDELKSRSKLTGAELDREDFEDLEGVDLSDDAIILTELEVKIVPPMADEFVCTSCFLVMHRSQNTSKGDTPPVCRDCND